MECNIESIYSASRFRGGRGWPLLHSLDVLITPLSMAPVLAFVIEGQWDGVLEVEGCGLPSGVSSPK
jgi:hypothetical protein